MDYLVKPLVKRLIEDGLRGVGDWETQGLGMLRLRVSREVRLHIWHKGLIYEPRPSEIHSHPWNFTSTVIVGRLDNIKYREVVGSFAPNASIGTIKCGVGGGLLDDSTRPAQLREVGLHEYGPGESYSQMAEDLHATTFLDGTVTVIERTFKEDTEHAKVAYLGDKWITAEPRPATLDERKLAFKAALGLF